MNIRLITLAMLFIAAYNCQATTPKLTVRRLLEIQQAEAHAAGIKYRRNFSEKYGYDHHYYHNDNNDEWLNKLTKKDLQKIIYHEGMVEFISMICDCLDENTSRSTQECLEKATIKARNLIATELEGNLRSDLTDAFEKIHDNISHTISNFENNQ